MIKKLRTGVGLLCFFFTLSALTGQTARHTAADIVVLMDTSGTVLPYYEAINKRVLQSIISKFIRIGDTFHLLSFSAVPLYEMSQKVDSEADLSRIVSRFMLLYQLGQSADFLSGINFAEQYMKELPSKQDKILIIISDGIFNPPASSPYRHYSGERVKTELAKRSASIRAQGWKVYYVKLPFPSDAVIKDLDGAFYAGRLNTDASVDRSGVDNNPVDASTAKAQAAVADTAGSASHMSGRDTEAAGQPAADFTTSTGINATRQSTSSNGAQASGNLPQDSLAAAATPQSGTPQPATDGSAPQKTANDGTADSKRAEQSRETAAGTVKTAGGHNGADTSEAGVVSATTGITDSNTASDADGSSVEHTGSVKTTQEYTDVSHAFTENLGIEPSELPAEGTIAFHDTAIPLPRIAVPDKLDVSGSTFKLPLTVFNDAAESIRLTVRAVSIGADNGIQKQQLKNISITIASKAESQVTVPVTLPQSLHAEGQYRTDIRFDLSVQDTSFSHAAAIVLTVKPALISSLLNSKQLWIGLAVPLLICAILLFIMILRRRSSDPVKYAARAIGQQAESRQNTGRATVAEQQSAINKSVGFNLSSTEQRYYPEQPANKGDPRESLNAFSSQTAAQAIETQKETASQMTRLAREQALNTEGRFALLNSAEVRMNRRPGFTQSSHSAYTGSKKPSQSGMMELFVYNQTTSIGKRNIHVMKPGARMSIGGSKNDDFFIFLVPFPANLAQVQYDGNDYRLSILKKEYFPYENSTIIYNCIGKDITVVSKKGYHVTFTFRGYEDPMVRLNAILTSISYT